MHQKIFIVLLALALVSCSNSSKNNYLIAKNQVGLLNANTQLHEVDAIFKKDSVVKMNLEDRFRTNVQDFEVYQTNGDKLLVIEPRKANDSTSTIKQIQVIGSQFKTEKGLGPDSTFKDIYENYEIGKIQNTFLSVLVSINEIDAFVTINKKQLPEELRTGSDIEIRASQIPDEAKIENFWVNFTVDEDK